MLGQHLGNTVIQIAHYTDLLPNPPDPRSTLIQTSHKHVAARQQQQHHSLEGFAAQIYVCSCAGQLSCTRYNTVQSNISRVRPHAAAIP